MLLNNSRYTLRAKAKFTLVRACIEFEKEHGTLTLAEWLWVFQQEQNALVERLLQEQKNVENSNGE